MFCFFSAIFWVECLQGKMEEGDCLYTLCGMGTNTWSSEDCLTNRGEYSCNAQHNITLLSDHCKKVSVMIFHLFAFLGGCFPLPHLSSLSQVILMQLFSLFSCCGHNTFDPTLAMCTVGEINGWSLAEFGTLFTSKEMKSFEFSWYFSF